MNSHYKKQYYKYKTKYINLKEAIKRKNTIRQSGGRLPITNNYIKAHFLNCIMNRRPRYTDGVYETYEEIISSKTDDDIRRYNELVEQRQLRQQGGRFANRYINADVMNLDTVRALLQIECSDEFDYSCDKTDGNCIKPGLYQDYRSNIIRLDEFNAICKEYRRVTAAYYSNSLSRQANNCSQKIIEYNYDFIIKKVIPKDAIVFMVGDLHSSLMSIIEIIRFLHINKMIDNNYTLRKDVYFIFLGDLVDRGPFGIEILYIAMKLHLANINQDNVFIIRGNHETAPYYDGHNFGLKTELKSLIHKDRPQSQSDESDYYSKHLIHSILKTLPLSVFIRFDEEPETDSNGWYLLCHGGIVDIMHFLLFSRAFGPTFGQLRTSVINSDETLTRFLNDTTRDILIFNDVFDPISTQALNQAFLFSDFQKQDESATAPRPTVGLSRVREFFENVPINNIIRGHQDIVNLSIIREPCECGECKNCLMFNHSIFYKNTLDTFDHSAIGENNNNFTIDNDTYVITTSTANSSRGNAYLMTDEIRNENTMTLEYNKRMSRITVLTLSKEDIQLKYSLPDSDTSTTSDEEDEEDRDEEDRDEEDRDEEDDDSSGAWYARR